MKPQLSLIALFAQLALCTTVPNAYAKQIAAIRRRSGLTHYEFLQYHTIVHGLKSWNAPDDIAKPLAYYQNHVFDSVFGANNSVPEPSWHGRDNVIELYSRAESGFLSPPPSNYTQTVTGPDGANFNDLDTAFSMFTYEKFHNVSSSCSGRSSVGGLAQNDGYGTDGLITAFFWVAATDAGLTFNNVSFAESVAASFIEDLSGSIYKISSHTPVPGTDARAYFGGQDMPAISAVIKLWLSDANKAVRAVRSAQTNLTASIGVNVDNSFLTFSRSVTLWDESRNITLDVERLERFVELETRI